MMKEKQMTAGFSVSQTHEYWQTVCVWTCQQSDRVEGSACFHTDSKFFINIFFFNSV